MIQKVVNFSPEWVAGFTRNQWQVRSGMGGSFEPESATDLRKGLESLMALVDDYSGKVNY